VAFETALVARFGLRFHGAISGDMALKAACNHKKFLFESMMAALRCHSQL
jgi:hypothetical protein